MYETRKETRMVDGKEIVELITYGNNLYDWYRFDSTPLLRLVGNINWTNISNDVKKKLADIPNDERIVSGFDELSFSTQIDNFIAKYPELYDNTLILKLLVPSKLHAVESLKKGSFEPKDLLNELSQNLVTLNLNANPKDRFEQEDTIRTEWERLSKFTPSFLNNVLSDNISRYEFYSNLKNKDEISQFFKNLAYYAFNQSSHFVKTHGQFSYLAPSFITSTIVEESIENFYRFVDSISVGKQDSKEVVLKEIFQNFEKVFRDVNDDLNWTDNKYSADKYLVPNEVEDFEYDPNKVFKSFKKEQDPGLPYKKAISGAYYNIVAYKLLVDSSEKRLDPLSNKYIKPKFFNMLMKEDNAIFGHNEFYIEKDKNDYNDPLQCKLK